MSQTRTIRWVLYHEPVDLFLRTAKAFSEELARTTDGRLSVEILTTQEYAEKYNKDSKLEPLVWMQSGDAEMTQIHVTQLADWHAPDFYALELPFLFDSHEHATRVLEGQIGETMLSDLEKTTPVRGLAFTYSGGYRCLALDRAITTAEDLKGLTMITNTNPVAIDTAEAFGCIAVPVSPKDVFSGKKNTEHNHYGNNAIETTLPRYEAEAKTELHTYISNTKHSMYLTSILIAKDFWNSLDQADQEAIKGAAMHSSTLERQWTVEDSHKIANSTEEQAKLGVTYAELDDSERAKLKDAVQPLYNKYRKIFSVDLVDGIIKG
jgi:TRAP-type C4-dicarboxylate transport system substrate-binding protein